MSLKWTTSYKPVKVKKFTASVGPTAILPSTVIDMFLCFFTEELLRMITEQSNLFAEQAMEQEEFQRWVKITTEEIKAYLGFIILMGLVRLPSIYDYWSTNPIYNYSPIANRITRDRFFEVHKYLHFTDNSELPRYGSPGYDKLGKIRPVVEYLNTRFLSMYNPHNAVSIDEAMIKFKGRSSMKQYMPKKPIKRGFKVWVRGDATNGYVSELEVYVGKTTSDGEKGLGRHVVEKLTNKLKGKYYHVYFDNFFTSVTLLRSLSQNKLYGCGTMRSDRLGFPAQFKPKVKKGLRNRGDFEVVQYGNLTVYLWQDTKPVIVISSNTNATDKTTVTRKQHDGSTIQIDCPQAICNYNKFMGGVDLNDQIRNYYTYHIKSRKSYRYIFFFLFHLSITNAFILAKQHSSTISVRNIKQFRQQLAMELIGTYQSRKRARNPTATSSAIKRPTLLHFPHRGADVHRCYYCSLSTPAKTDHMEM